VGRHSTFLSREEHGVAAGALFYKVEGEKHCVMRKAIQQKNITKARTKFLENTPQSTRKSFRTVRTGLTGLDLPSRVICAEPIATIFTTLSDKCLCM
jgi:hypothetical protein